MKIVAFNGSPRARNSNTDKLLLPLLEGARAAGAAADEFYLEELDVRPCKGCFTCWTRTPGRCVQTDDMQGVLKELIAAQAVVWAFPLYCYGVPARMQALQERIIPIVMPHMREADEVHVHPSRYPGRRQRWVVLSNCGFPEQAHFDAVISKFRLLAGAGGDVELVEPIVMGAGELLPAMEANAGARQALTALQDELRAAGRELGESGTIRADTVRRLSRPLTERLGMSAKAYARAANAHFDAALRQASHETGSA